MNEQRMRVRPMNKSDLETVRGWRNHKSVRAYMYNQHEIGEEEHRAWFERISRDSYRHPLVFEIGKDKAGFVQFSVLDARARRAEWGFYLAPTAPRGSGKKLGACALSYAFNQLSLHKVCGEALAFNERSICFHERLGFRREALFRDHYFDGEKYHDVIGFGLLADDWFKQAGT